MVFRVRLFLILYLFFSISSFAQRVISVDDSTTEFILHDDYLSIYEDKGNNFTIQDIKAPNFQNNFTVNKTKFPYNERVNSTYWIRFQVINKSIKRKKFLLESYSPHTIEWDVFIDDGSTLIQKKSGLIIDFYQREFVNKNLILDLPLDSGKVYTFYARVHSSNYSSFDYRIKSLSYFFFYSVNEYYFLGIYYGILLIMAIYNFLIYLSLREKVYIYYVLYVISGMLTSLAEDSIGSQYLWVNFPELNSLIGSSIAPLMLLVTFVLYSREFLRLNRKFPLYDKIIICATIGYITYFLFRILVLPEYLYFRGTYLIPFFLVYLIAIQSYVKGYKPARYMIIGFAFILVSIIIIRLRSNGTIEGNLFTVYSFNLGLVLEVIVLSYALADRLKFSKLSKEKALRERNIAQFDVIKQLRINEQLKDKVNKELEEKVLARTDALNHKNEELETLNGKLKEMTDKANQMSLKLDVDNWNLQLKIIDSIRDRMLGQEVSFEEFLKLFPDDTACYRYLNELKRNNHFTCRKCSNHGSVVEEKIFSKRCTACNYVESVTSHTLFHALKFPIHKAFYILYSSLYSQERLTLNELSVLLDLRKNTCWKFKQKVTEAEDYLDKVVRRKPGSEGMRKWELIIYNEFTSPKHQ